MTLTMGSLTAALAVGVGALGIAAPLAHVPHGSAAPVDPAAVTVLSEDLTIDARRRFAETDQNSDGFVDRDEYVSGALVRAELARFSGSITINGLFPMSVTVDGLMGAERRLRAEARTNVEKHAGRRFDKLSVNGAPLSQLAWLTAEEKSFADMDANENGRLEGDELVTLARRVAALGASLG